jgi:rubrerythrin
MNGTQKRMNTMNNVHNDSYVATYPSGMAGLDRVKEYRCPVCKRLLMKGQIVIIETRCPKCKKISIIRDR